MTDDASSRRAPLVVVKGESSDDVDTAVDRLVASDERPPVDDFPRLRRDLKVTKTDGGDVIVRAPEASTEFRLYDLEWQAAVLMDGTQSISEIAAALSHTGIGATKDLVASFVKELRGYRFLDTAAQPTRDADLAAEWTGMNDHERQLIELAKMREARGDIEGANDYMLAVLEINPTNQRARKSLRRLTSSLKEMTDEASQAAKAKGETGVLVVAAPTETSVESAPSQKKSERKVGLISALVLVTVGVGVGAFFSRPYVERLFGEAPAEASFAGQAHSGSPDRAGIRNRSILERYRAVLRLKDVAVVRAPASGIFTEIAVGQGDQVERGQEIAFIFKPKQHKRVARARKSLAEFTPMCRDPAYRSMCDNEETRLGKLLAKAKTDAVAAAGPGRVQRIVGLPERRVKMSDPLFEIVDTSRLLATIETEKLSFPLENAGCEVLDFGLEKTPCTIHMTRAGLEIEIDNRAGQLVTGQSIGIGLRPTRP